jgi:hypothetical protein
MTTTSNYWFGGAAAYQINQSLRFNSADSATLTRTPASASNQKTYTFSFWHKGTARYDDKKLFVVGATSVTSGFVELSATGSGSGGKAGIRHSGNSLTTSAIYRDPSAWAHYVFAFDSTQATDTNRLKLYVNGEQVTITGTWFAQDAVSRVNSTDIHTIGVGRSFSGTNDGFLDAYLAEFNFIDGTALTPSSFGETDTITGAWIPKKYSGSYGTNGFYLKFDPSATNGIGHDHSGNGNNFTATGFSTSGTGTDVMSDTPTNNWCTLNPLEKPGGTAPVYENGNLTLRNSTNYFFAHGVGTFALNSGKWYFETSGDTSIYVQIGFLDSSQITSMTGGGGISGANISWHYQSNGIIRGLSSTYQDTGLTAASTAGDIMGLAIDFDAGEASWYVNGTQVGSTVDFSSYLASGRTWYPVVAVTNEGTDITNVNFGQRAFAYTPPTGYKALNTQNLPEPTVKDGSKYFNTVLWTGNGSTQSITGVGFQPDFVWSKTRSPSGYGHWLGDVVRGGNERLASDSTQEGRTNEGNITFDTDGFSVTSTHPSLNNNTSPIVAWNWKASNTSGSTNTAGTITSTVSANPTAGFSIVTYTGNGNNGATIGHGLGVEPAMIILKERTSSPHSGNWFVYHKNLPSQPANINLNNTSSSAPINATGQGGMAYAASNASSVFQIYTGASGVENANRSTATYVAYCFSEVAGYSKFGSYTGNGSSDGVFIHCGFRPAFFMWKVTSTTGSWGMLDTSRDTYNVSGKQLFPNNSNAEASYTVCDFLSNGVKMRNTFGDTNGSGATYVFAAFAELPFKYANAR